MALKGGRGLVLGRGGKGGSFGGRCLGSHSRCWGGHRGRELRRFSASSPSEVSVASLPPLPYELGEGVKQDLWQWGRLSVRYQRAGLTQENRGKPAVVLIHGFGGNCDHWRKNIGPLSKDYRVYSLDLLGYGFSSKPNPKEYGEPNAIYNFYTWADQINAFLDEVVHAEGGQCPDTVLVANSVGSCAGLQAIANWKGRSEESKAVWSYKGIALLNPSLRLLHVKKQAWFARPFVKLFQDFLRETPVGELFFSQVAQPKAIQNILKEAYCDATTVSDELVSCVLNPGLQPGAVEVFLDFISYSGGPLPEELIPQMPCPVELIWGEADPWESIDVGRREYASFDTVRNFVPLSGVGHCPMDEAPQLVNPLIKDFVRDVTL
ncbi:alpha/beta fold hydrolase [Chloropicon primus]|uniref:Alpha/beta fold hydrolase n=2 Tax=Chloropicon primus TaxID=1764295 RepID=A0A5B8MNE8_9CHLO|nr:alpha/beta fold hydrolase [Chloropicon primus]UPR01229.1 alpha/beta fold hydrolase [Chloropicon primus]|eukprot:QDZ22009.1 alpha/beta fold hydrolase [Chloropicon primus]